VGAARGPPPPWALAGFSVLAYQDFRVPDVRQGYPVGGSFPGRGAPPRTAREAHVLARAGPDSAVKENGSRAVSASPSLSAEGWGKVHFVGTTGPPVDFVTPGTPAQALSSRFAHPGFAF